MILSLELLEDRLAPSVTVRIDYSLDANNFFDTPEKRNILQSALDEVVTGFTDDLSALSADGINTYTVSFTNPSTGQPHRLTDPFIPAGELIVYVGAAPLGGNTVGLATGVGLSASGMSPFLDLIFSRGQVGAVGSNQTDYGPIGGSITFNINANWYFGVEPFGMTSTQNDLYAIAQHEFIHLLGFSQAASYENQISGGAFLGETAMSVFGGPVPLSSDLDHYTSDTRSFGALAIMNESKLNGTRNHVTALDWAILREIGWEFDLPSFTQTSLEGQLPTLTATVTSPDGMPTGYVTFRAGNQILGHAPLQNGVAVLNQAPTPFGNATIEAIYSGNTNFAPSGSTFTGTLPPPPPPMSPPMTPPVLPPASPPVSPPVSPQPILSIPPPSGIIPTGQNTTSVYAVSTGAGLNQVSVFDGNEFISQFEPFTFAESPGGARIAVADVDGDGVPDVIAGTGPLPSGIFPRFGYPGPLVRIFNGTDNSLMRAFAPFESSFTGGVYVSAGDITGDGRADYVVSPDEGGGPRVRIFDGGTGMPIADFFGIDDPNFRGGVRTALGDINGDGIPDLIVAAGFGGGPRVAIFDGASLQSVPTKLIPDFFLFEAGLRNGAFVTLGDLDGDGYVDLIAGGGPGGGPRVLAISGRDLLVGQQTLLANFFAGDPNNRGGVRVSAKDIDSDGSADVVVASGTGASPSVTVYLGSELQRSEMPSPLSSFSVFDPAFTGGVFVG